MPLLDTVIRVAQKELCAVRWSAQILDEAQRNVMADRSDPVRIAARFDAMRAAFPDWEVCGYEELIPAMTSDSKDRHVLAAAVVCGAGQIVTRNRSDFPASSLAPYGIEAVSPDDSLLNVSISIGGEPSKRSRRKLRRLRSRLRRSLTSSRRSPLGEHPVSPKKSAGRSMVAHRRSKSDDAAEK